MCYNSDTLAEVVNCICINYPIIVYIFLLGMMYKTYADKILHNATIHTGLLMLPAFRPNFAEAARTT